MSTTEDKPKRKKKRGPCQIGRSQDPMIRVCATCPFRTTNHNKPHPAKWYSLTNIRRLWNGMRTGKCPGMICHETDPKNKDYGGDKDIKPGCERECAGAQLIRMQHYNEFSDLCKAGDPQALKTYCARHKLPMNRDGMVLITEQFLFGQLPPVADQTSEVSLPWENETP